MHKLAAGTGDTPRLGDGAEHPHTIPALGWYAVLCRLWRSTSQSALWVAAGGVAFYGFLALIPSLGVLILMYGFVIGHDRIKAQLEQLEGILPQEAIGALVDQLTGTAANAGGGFGWGMAGSLFLMLWSTVLSMRALIAALNQAYCEVETRGFVPLNTLALGLGMAALLFVIGTIGVFTAAPSVLAKLEIGSPWDRIVRLVQWPLLAGIVLLTLAVLFRVAPCRRAPKWRWLSWGAVIATALWIAGSVGFSAYVRQIVSYQSAYGLAGAVVTLMLWLALIAYVVLLGAALNAELERQTSRDTTVGPERPVGGRGARAADTLGDAPTEPQTF